MNKKYKFLNFPDGWWSVIFYTTTQSWGKWRGPFDYKSDAQLDCANASRGEYELP